jgi:hypothetical protein
MMLMKDFSWFQLKILKIFLPEKKIKKKIETSQMALDGQGDAALSTALSNFVLASR